ncbi:unnamed protein product [Dicrocoelium dendriticum]|nr:unnamed protein product [Dicrocoelium dendriticum]
MPNFCVSESHPVCTPTHNTGGKLKSALKYQPQKECGKDSTEINPSFQGAKMNLLRELFLSHDSRSAFYQTFLISLKQAMKSVRLGEASMRLSLFNDGDTLHNADSLDHLGSRTSLLLQPPAFATSVQGPLFGIPGCSIGDESVEEPSPTWSRQFHSSFTVHGVMTSWVGAVCTGAGLPWPTIRVSESVSSFVSLVVSAVIPGLLSLLDSDLQPSIDHVSSSNETSGAVHFTMFDSNQPSEEQPHTASGSEDPHIPVPDRPEDRPMKYYFQPLVTSILRTLVQFLRGGASHAEFDGVLVQIQEVVAGAEDDLSGVTSVAGCISSCLLLRSLCHLLTQLFRDRFSVSVYEDVETLDKTANNNFATLAAELVKHYYSAICVLSENVVDLSIVHGDQLVSEIALYTYNGVDLDPPAVRFSKFLRNLWKVVSQTCPSGLARQILAQVSAKCLSYAVQLFTLPDFLESTTDADRLKTDLLILLDTATFCLFACSETTAEVIGDGLMSGDISLLHWSATLLAQTLICRFMPNDVWDRVHGDGFYENLVKDGRPFAYASSNWLCFARPSLFTDVPISLVRERGQQTELEIEWELFEHGAHFDPIRLLSLLTSWDAKLSVDILTAPQLHAFHDLTEESDTAVRIFFAIFRICSLIPELDSFHSTVLLTVYSNSIQGATQPSTIDADSADLTALDHWPVWFRALLKLLDQQPINKLWESFHSLVQRHVFSDEFFSETCLLLTEGQSPAFLLSHHQPKRCSCWNTMFPSGQLPCGCEIPMPPRLDQISRLLRRSDDDTDTAADQPTLSKQQQARQLKLHRERTIGSYAFYYSQGGHLLCAWQELACDLIRSIIIALSTGLLLALSSLEKVLMDAQAHSSASPRLQGGCLSTHLLLAALLNRIRNAARQESMTSIQLLQHLVLWEYLCGLIEASDREEADDEVADCKKRMLSYLEDLPNSLNESPEPADSTFAGRRFKLGQYVRTVQDHALPDLCFLHKFFKANVPWIRSLINRWRATESTTGAEIGPKLRDLDLVADDSDVPYSSAASYQELNWEHLSLVNIGLTKDTVRKLRDNQPDSSSERSSLET